MSVSAKSLELSTIQQDDVAEVWRVSYKTSKWILRLGVRKDFPEEKLIFNERTMMRKEPQILELISKNTSIKVPKIYHFQKEDPLLMRDWMLMECIPGKTMSSEKYSSSRFNIFSNQQISQQIGSILSEIHSLKSSQYGYIFDESPIKPQNNWADAFKLIFNKTLDKINLHRVLPANQTKNLKKQLEDNVDAFNSVTGSHLTHMGFYGCNLLINSNNKITGVIDWDQSLWGDPLVDFCGKTPWRNLPVSLKLGYKNSFLYGTTEEKAIRSRFYIILRQLRTLFISKVRPKQSRVNSTLNT